MSAGVTSKKLVYRWKERKDSKEISTQDQEKFVYLF